jgi:hypothetical protein
MLYSTNNGRRETSMEVLIAIAATPAFAGGEAAKTAIDEGFKGACRGSEPTAFSGCSSRRE